MSSVARSHRSRGAFGAREGARAPGSGAADPVAQIELVIVDDHPPVRQGLELLLAHEGFRVIGSAGSAASGTSMIRARRPRVALVDIDLGDGSGTDLAKAVRDEGCDTAIVLCTGSLDNALIDEAVASGAHGLVLKSSPIEHLADAIRTAAAGQHYVDRLIAQLPGRSAGRGDALVTKREAQILGMISQGSTTQQVASDLFLSPETVKSHVSNVKGKLGAHNRLHAVVIALVRGDIELPAVAR
jgi:DNA-binding NarL/FixJ family response regulator